MTTAAEALELAIAEVARVIETGETKLDFKTDERFRALEVLPDNIGLAHNVTEIDLDYTQVSDISAVSGLTLLELLNLNGTQVSDISVLSGLAFLSWLYLQNTQVSDIGAISNITSLKILNLDHTHVSDIRAVSGLTNLQLLYMDNTQINNINAVSELINLEGLSLSNTQVNDISVVSGLTNLEALYINNTHVSDISAVFALTNLETISLDNTKVSDISGMANLTAMHWLRLGRTQVSDLRPLKDLTSFDTEKSILTFESTPATKMDPELDRLSKIEGIAERIEKTLAYLKTLKDWPPVGAGLAEAPVQDNVLKVDFINGKYDVLPSKVSEAEIVEPLKQKLLQALREAVDRLAILAGNYHPALADAARRLSGHLKPDLQDLDMVDIHLALDRLRGAYNRRAERKGEDVFGPDVVDVLQEVINIGPGLVLANKDVELLEARRRSYNDNPISSDQVAAHQKVSGAIVNEPDLFGERAVAISTATAGEVQEPDNRNWVARTVLNKNAAILILSTVALDIATSVLGVDGLMGMTYIWVVEVAPSLLTLADGWGQSAVAWATPIINQAREAVEAAKSLKKPNN